MQVTQNQLQDLLELCAIDQQMVRSKATVKALAEDSEYQQLQAQLRESSAAFVAANNQIDAIKLDLKRLETDVDLVDKRMAKDNAALRTTSVVKDAQGLQGELRTLERRKAELEDQELELMEQLEAANRALAEVRSSRAGIEGALKSAVARLEAEQAKLVSGISLAQGNRVQLVGRIPAELLASYDQKAKRGVPVGRLVHGECSACHINLSASNLADLAKAPSTNLVTCPDCGAILVR